MTTLAIYVWQSRLGPRHLSCSVNHYSGSGVGERGFGLWCHFIWCKSLSGLIARSQYNPIDLNEFVLLVIAVLIEGAWGSFMGSSKFVPKTMQKVLGAIILVGIVVLTKRALSPWFDRVAGGLPRFQPHFCGLVLENIRPACRLIQILLRAWQEVRYVIQIFYKIVWWASVNLAK